MENKDGRGGSREGEGSRKKWKEGRKERHLRKFVRVHLKLEGRTGNSPAAVTAVPAAVAGDDVR